MAFVDGSVVDGRTVVILTVAPRGAGPKDGAAAVTVAVAGAEASEGSSGEVAPNVESKLPGPKVPVFSAIHAPSKAQLAEAQAQALGAAAALGAPFCADCAQANDKLAQAERATW